MSGPKVKDIRMEIEWPDGATRQLRWVEDEQGKGVVLFLKGGTLPGSVDPDRVGGVSKLHYLQIMDMGEFTARLLDFGKACQ